MRNRPLIGVTCCLIQGEASTFHRVQDKYVDAVADGADGLPVLVPALGGRLDAAELAGRLDGLLLTGSPSNVDPARYGGPPPRPDDEADPARDATTLPLALACIDAGVPLFAVCRGIQELNVALGGSLHQHVQELPGKRDHRSDKTKPYAARYAPVHEARIEPGGAFARLFPGERGFMVNSLHGQGIDRVAPGLRVEAVAPDGIVEAVSLPDAKGFVLAVQWHPEWQVRDYPVHLRLFRAFGDAARARAASRQGQERAP
ncbi:MAG: gamma-glutamyl-gamma-aminobutyrate hydrolase family protein [Geminicoccaceae bacterium]|nr:gamma-glutamyl-gamma-aminobutyrate hydrolase family protein [Geminicoccaceae bacterium]